MQPNLDSSHVQHGVWRTRPLGLSDSVITDK